MMFGLSGAHRTGKTTLAKAVASKLKINYFDASVSRIMRQYGVNGVADLALPDRIAAQEFLLEKFIDNIKAAPYPSISDRTPLDMIGYMLGELTMHNTPAELHDRIQAYVDRCKDATQRHFQLVMILRPLPIFEVDPSKPPSNRAYQTLVQYIIEGSATNSEYLQSAVLDMTGLDNRIEAACSAIEVYGESLSDQVAGLRPH